VANKFFFMLAEGSGTSPYGTSPTCDGAPAVSGIGREAAGAVWYRALTNYMVSNANYATARQATLSAAIDLHGAGSPQYASVEAAWNAVGVDATRQLPQAPTVRNPGWLHSVLGEPASVQIEATDAQGGPLTYSAVGLPDGLTLNDQGLITGVPTTEELYRTDFTVTDQDGNAATAYLIWEIDGPPVFDPTTVTPRANRIGDSVFEYFWVDDFDYPITWTVTGLPDGVVHAKPTDSWVTGQATRAGVWTVTVTATDSDNMSSSTTFTWTVETEPVTGPPTELTASRSGADVTVRWNRPVTSNWVTLTGYVVTAEPGGHRVTVDSWSTYSAVLHDLDPQTSYTISVFAVNPGGLSPAATVEVS
jgi:hypothetical protein